MKLADYVRLDMRLGLTSEKWDVIAYVDNVLDEDAPLLVTAFPNFERFPAVVNAFHIVPRRDRNAGITLTYRF